MEKLAFVNFTLFCVIFAIEQHWTESQTTEQHHPGSDIRNFTTQETHIAFNNVTDQNNSKSKELKDLYLMGLFPMTGPWPAGGALLPAALMAVDHINADPNILQGYRLNLLWNDTQVGKCNHMHALILYNKH